MDSFADIPPAQKPEIAPRRAFASCRAIFALMLREMATTYGKSPGGYIWAVMEPVLGIAFLTFVFSLLFRSPPIGNSFAMFYATGLLPFMVFNEVQSKTSGALSYSRQLLAYPTVTFLDALLARALLTLLTQLLVAHLIFGGAMFLFEGWLRFDLWKVLESFLLSIFLGLGIGSVNCYIMLKIPLWQQAWSVLMRPLVILSGVMMLFTTIPQPYQDWIWWNPIVHIIGLMRQGFYESYDGSYISVFYVLMVSMGTLTIGILLLWRHYRDLLERN